MKKLTNYLLLYSAAFFFIGCNADDGSTLGQTNGGNPGGISPAIKLGLLRDYYHFDNTITPPHQIFPVDNLDPVTLAFQYDDMTGYNAVEFRLTNGESSSLRIKPDTGPNLTDFVTDVVGMVPGQIGLVDLVQYQSPFRQSEEVIVYAVNVLSQRTDGTFEISGQKEIGRLILDFYANKLVDIELINARTFSTAKKTNDAPKKYNGPRLKELADYFITTAAITMTSVTSSDRDLVFDDNEDGALDLEPILGYRTPEFITILQYEIPGLITVINIKDIFPYFSLAASVNAGDKELVITALGGFGLPKDEAVFIDDEDNTKDEYVIASLKPGSAQTYNIIGGGSTGGFKFPHTSPTTKVNSPYRIQGLASPVAHVAVVQEGDFAYKDEETRDILFGVTVAHEIFHGQDFKLDHVNDPTNVMYTYYPPGGTLNKVQWDKIHGL